MSATSPIPDLVTHLDPRNVGLKVQLSKAAADEINAKHRQVVETLKDEEAKASRLYLDTLSSLAHALKKIEKLERKIKKQAEINTLKWHEPVNSNRSWRIYLAQCLGGYYEVSLKNGSKNWQWRWIAQGQCLQASVTNLGTAKEAKAAAQLHWSRQEKTRRKPRKS